MTLDTIKVLDAVAFATSAHDGQRRKYENTPYILHPIRVAKRVSCIDQVTTDMVCAALLHDVLEDCPQITSFDIENRFGHEVYRLVSALTDDKVVRNGPNRAVRKAMTRDRLHVAGWAAQSIKCADLIDNLSSIVANDKNFGKVFIFEAYALVEAMPLAEATIRDEILGDLEYFKRWGSTASA